ncbi:hypothetical protein KGF54_000577 [Candida jiufengensis]|uniref:uncharacterized protein n=1 Tax=Candida jiufengensis TaxID=497108 RepID=UPI002224828D|nr:uncharacterized protein KGF54_000577 [Candida jiufengensis]KAI5956958.1 hypothetical protein KGF54_000577 [Candida jiufengensis]
MLLYLDEELTYDQFIKLLIDQNYNNGYILISDLELYNEKLINFNLTPKQINIIIKFKIILIESWNDLYEFIKDFHSFNQSTEKALVAIYGILKNYIEIGFDETSNLFIKHNQFSALELNKLFHQLFVFQQDKNISIVFNDGIEKSNDENPLIGQIEIPNLYVNREETKDRRILIKNDKTLNDDKIEIRVLMIKWFKLISKEEFITNKSFD